jgi:hypothetical protein
MWLEKMAMLNSLLLQLLCLLLLFLAILLNRAEWLDPKWPLLSLGGIMGMWLLLASYVLLSYGYMVYRSSAVGGTSDWWNIALALVPLLCVSVIVLRYQQVPPIHDITTDMVNPPVFEYARQVRHSSHNSTDYQANNKILQRQAYPHIKTLMLSQPPAELIPLIEKLVTQSGWHIQRTDLAGGIIQAYTKTPFLGFVDDIVIRIIADSEGSRGGSRVGSRVDMRSASRIGMSDFGVNAKRIETFLDVVSQSVK